MSSPDILGCLPKVKDIVTRTKCSAANDILSKHPELRGHLNENNINVKLNNYGAVEDTFVVVNNQQFPIDEENEWLPKAKTSQAKSSYSKPSIIQPIKKAIGFSDEEDLESLGGLSVEQEIQEMNNLISNGSVTSSKLAKLLYSTNATTGLHASLILDAVKAGNFDSLGKCPNSGVFSRSTCSRYLKDLVNEGLIERRNKTYNVAGAQASERARLLSQVIEIWEKTKGENPSEIKAAFEKAKTRQSFGEKPL